MHNFLSNFFFAQLERVITKINKSQKISTRYVMHVLFILEKTRQNWSTMDPFRSSRVKRL